jgi:ATP-binding cassette subfamily B protein
MKTLKFIWLLFREFPRLFILNVILSGCVALASVASIVSLAPVIDIIIKQDVSSSSAITQRFASYLQKCALQPSARNFLVIFLLFIILKNGFLIMAKRHMFNTKYTVIKQLVLKTYNAFFNACWQFFSSGNQGVLLNTLTREANVSGDAFAIMGNLFSDALCLLFYLSIPFTISWKITALCIALAVFFIIPIHNLGRINYRLGKNCTTAANRVASLIHETLGAAKLILGFGTQQRSITEISKSLDHYRRAAVNAQTLYGATAFIYEPVGISIVILGFYLAYRYYTIPLSEVLIMFYALRTCMPLIGQITANKNNLSNYLPSYEQIKQLEAKARQHRQKTGGLAFVGLKKGVEMRRVTFGYPGKTFTVDAVSLEVPKGKMIALVGESGSGKSTVLDLIMGFYEPTEGTVLVDDIPLSRYDIYSYRAKIGFVPQDTILFNTTIRENLRWGKDDVSQEEIDNACKQAHAYEFIHELPLGYDTEVGDRGVRLSGGQRQRIALARAIIRKPELLLLDEATSALDSQSEMLIQRAINDLARKTTIVIVAHRLSTIANADYIYVMENGSIIEQGTYHELVVQNGVFAHMIQLQSLKNNDANA